MELDEVNASQKGKNVEFTECSDKKESIAGAKKESEVRFKISFVGEVAEKLTTVSNELKRRGASLNVLTEFIGDEILNRPDHFWEKWLDEVTPGHFYLTAIQKDPDLQAKLEKMLKQMYLGRSKPSVPKDPRRKVSEDLSTPENTPE